MLKVGLTGGIGSGKTTVAKVFETLGVPVYYADDAAKRLMNEDPVLKEQISNHFGTAAYDSTGILNRQYIAEIVFKDRRQLELLNSLVHPITMADAERWFSRITGNYAIKEAALLFESGAAAGLDLVIGVTAPTALRTKRVMERDDVTAAAVQQRMQNQLQDSLKMRLCDYVIQNNEQQPLLLQLLSIHQALTHRSKTEP